jgi:hypothetical protein
MDLLKDDRRMQKTGCIIPISSVAACSSNFAESINACSPFVQLLKRIDEDNP